MFLALIHLPPFVGVERLLLGGWKHSKAGCVHATGVQSRVCVALQGGNARPNGCV